MFKGRHHRTPGRILLWILAVQWMLVPEAGATQIHTCVEGILVHQVGHLFFLISMVVLMITIQNNEFHLEKGWRWIQFSALFFILWNLDAFLVHYLDNQSGLILSRLLDVSRIDIQSRIDSPILEYLYYILRLDHLLCLPGMVCLFLGLSHILKVRTS